MKNIFVGNLDFGATESSLRALFEPYGKVERVNLVTDRDTGRARGFAFVEMTDAAEADRAIAALNGTNFGGRQINVNEARPKAQGAGRGFGGPPRQRREPRWSPRSDGGRLFAAAAIGVCLAFAVSLFELAAPLTIGSFVRR